MALIAAIVNFTTKHMTMMVVSSNDRMCKKRWGAELFDMWEACDCVGRKFDGDQRHRAERTTRLGQVFGRLFIAATTTNTSHSTVYLFSSDLKSLF